MAGERRLWSSPYRSAGMATAAGVLVMLAAAMTASRYAPSWFDPEEACRLFGRCVTEATEARRIALNQIQWAGFALVLLGVIRTWRGLPAARSSAPALPLPAWGHAAAAGLVGMASTAVLAPVALIAVIVVLDAAPAVLCVLWILQALALVALDRRVGTDGPRRAWLTGLVAAAPAVVTTAWVTVDVIGPTSLLLPVVDGAVLAAAVLVGRVVSSRGEGQAARPPRVRAAAGLTAFAVASVAALTFAGTRPPELPVPAMSGPQPRPIPLPPPAPEPAPSLGNADTGAAAESDVPVDAAVPCAPGDLVWRTAGWDAAMGTRAVTVIATHRGPQPCYVDGFAEIALAQGGRPLHLVTTPGSPTNPSAEVAADRVGIPPGGAASFALSWEGYGTAADQDTPQALTVSLPGAAPSEVPLGAGATPFDLVEGASVRVGPWQRATP